MNRKQFISTLFGAALSAVTNKILPKEKLYSARILAPEGHYFPTHSRVHNFGGDFATQYPTPLSPDEVLYLAGDGKIFSTKNLSDQEPVWVDVTDGFSILEIDKRLNEISYAKRIGV